MFPWLHQTCQGREPLVEGLEAVFLVSPGNVDDLAEAIKAACAQEIRAEAQAQAFEVRSRFRWPDGAVLDFYRSLV